MTRRTIWKDCLSYSAALVFVLVVHHALPFLALPTMGQAVWTAGFSTSFANDSILSIHARNFGGPQLAPIAFGLSGAYPAALFIAAGLSAADAYAAMVALWLSLALVGAFRIGTGWGLGAPTAALTGALWLSMPIVWGNGGYSMLSLGMALLPYYFWTALVLFDVSARNRFGRWWSAGLFLASCLVAVFMDGYTFVMFAVGALALAVYACARFPGRRRHLLTFSLPVLSGGFGVAFYLYTQYMGMLQFEASPMDIFRAWGVDPRYLVVPTRGVHWLFDVLRLSATRSAHELYGDWSVWGTTFAIPLIALGLFAWWQARQRSRWAHGFLFIGLFGLYMSLGPVLKWNTVKSPQVQSAPQIIREMPAGVGLVPTGSGWLSSHVPGFRNMRACYRWLALGALGFWLLWVLLLSEATHHRLSLAAATFVLIAFNLPHVRTNLRDSIAMRGNFRRIDDDLVADLRKFLPPHERVAFLPYANDFILNYVASRLDIRTYNVGGDKNQFMARQHWPLSMRLFPNSSANVGFSNAVLLMLARGDVEAVVIPYFDTLWGAHLWPCIRDSKQSFSSAYTELFEEPWKCPAELKNERSSSVSALQASSYLRVEDRSLFAVVRLAPEFIPKAQKRELEDDIARSRALYPIRLNGESAMLPWVLGEGWHQPEADHVWSSQRAVLELPVPEECSRVHCFASLKFWVFGSSEKRTVSVKFASQDTLASWASTSAVSSSAPQEVQIPLPGAGGHRQILIEVPDARSPWETTGSADNRTLGIAVSEIALLLPQG